MVAGGHVDGGHDICGGHTLTCNRTGREEWDFGELAVVVAVPFGDDDRLFLRAVLAEENPPLFSAAFAPSIWER